MKFSISLIQVDFAKAFVKRRSIKSNAKFHRNKKIILTIDIKDFFGSINKEKVLEIFKGLGYTDPLVQTFSSLCTLRNSLPQGAPTSPALSNLVFINLDLLIFDYCTKNEIHYSRYADDLTFSGDFEVGKTIKFISDLLLENGYTINKDKYSTPCL